MKTIRRIMVFFKYRRLRAENKWQHMPAPKGYTKEQIDKALNDAYRSCR